MIQVRSTSRPAISGATPLSPAWMSATRRTLPPLQTKAYVRITQ